MNLFRRSDSADYNPDSAVAGKRDPSSKSLHNSTAVDAATLYGRMKRRKNLDDDVESVPSSKSPRVAAAALFTEDVQFMFFSKSKDDPPGEGVQEVLSNGRSANEFADLQEFKDWRKQLSNFWISEFELDGLQWSSVEHYYQGSKFKEDNPKFYRQFSLDDPCSTINRDPKLAKSAGGKSGESKGVELRPKHLDADSNFFTTDRHIEEMKAGQLAKFSQNQDLKRMLLATKDAKLVHIVRGGESVVFHDLMEIRRQFHSV